MKVSKTLSRLAVGLSAAAMLAVSAPALAEDLQMWERSGGNAGMVDKLVEMWNAANPDRKINLTYIPHAEMVAKLAQAIASGDVPDLMGMDLIYAPQFEKAGQLVDITDKIKDWPELTTASPGHMTVRSTLTCRRYSTTPTFSRRPGLTRTSRRRALPRSANTPTRSPPSAAT
jgi:ABC-type glycerol-3-phosphate transport system substrate-binding protein